MRDSWFEFSGKVLELCRATLEAATTDMIDGTSQMLSCAVLARVQSNLDGALALIREDRILEARILARSCMENYFWTLALAESGDEFIHDFVRNDERRKRRRRKVAIDSRLEIEESILERLRSIAHVPRASRLRYNRPTQDGMVTRTQMANAYGFYSQLSEDSARPSLKALHRYWYASGRHSGSGRIRIGPAFARDEIRDTLRWICLASLHVCLIAQACLMNFLVRDVSYQLELLDLSRRLGSARREFDRLVQSSQGTTEAGT
jgi:uncharacterized protein DUF5677